MKDPIRPDTKHSFLPTAVHVHAEGRDLNRDNRTSLESLTDVKLGPLDQVNIQLTCLKQTRQFDTPRICVVVHRRREF